MPKQRKKAKPKPPKFVAALRVGDIVLIDNRRYQIVERPTLTPQPHPTVEVDGEIYTVIAQLGYTLERVPGPAIVDASERALERFL